jgi:translation elongation factor aEF-1 beta
MGNVAIRLRIMPDGTDIDLEPIKSELKKMGAKDVREQAVAFGLKALDVLFVVPDKGGSDLEGQISKIAGVGSVETEGITLI